MRVRAIGVGLALGALALCPSCRYYARPTSAIEDSCRADCSSMHQNCVSGGEAAKIGLPGVTFHACARELESCRERCERTAGSPGAP